MLYPLSDINYSLRRYYVDKFYSVQAANLADGSLVLDLGGNKVRKRGYFNIETYPLKVIYANLVIDKRPDIQSDAAQIPTSSARFDAVICAELLEHVSDPVPVLQEAYRVLKPGGCLLATVPFLFRIHGDPYDYGRYTDYYWQSNLKKIGYSNINIERQGSFYTVMADFLKQYASQYASERKIFPWITRQISPWLQHWAFEKESHLGDERWPEFLQSFTTGFGLCVIK